jgi:hypothetical protein
MKMKMMVLVVGLVGCSHGPIFVGPHPDGGVDDAGMEDGAAERNDAATAGAGGAGGDTAGDGGEDAATAGDGGAAGGTGGIGGTGGELELDGGMDAELPDAGSDGGPDAGDAALADAGLEGGPDAQEEEPQCRECVGDDQGDCPDGYWCFRTASTGILHYCSQTILPGEECSYPDLYKTPRMPYHPTTPYQCIPGGTCEQWRQEHGL